MATRRANPQRVKLHRSYSVPELSVCLNVHPNTVREWQRGGLKPIDTARPILFQGAIVRAFLTRRNADRKRPCGPGMIFCFRCRVPCAPALGMVDYVPLNPATGNLRALCETCGGMMHRRARQADLHRIMPSIEIRILDAPQRLMGSARPSLNSEAERQPTT
ncbi:helix-turn-helix domain-containing protein [Sphingomonas sp. Leaf357]|uniref:helix-turn-helix domain-containing protein n=1 Tax=Sphingomonas sp. Leaf357 TaxID=1736350 RepID=UPI0012E18DA0|nr:helix-turn-helix domain-containing protein [Sphingomonas sp. Leaf357]